MVDPAARSDDRRRDHIAPIEYGRRTMDQQDVDPVADRVADHRSKLSSRVAATFLNDQQAAERLQPSLGDFTGLVEDALLQPGEPGLDEPDRARLERCDAEQRSIRTGYLEATLNRLGRCGERDNLYRRDHHARLDHG